MADIRCGAEWQKSGLFAAIRRTANIYPYFGVGSFYDVQEKAA